MGQWAQKKVGIIFFEERDKIRTDPHYFCTTIGSSNLTSKQSKAISGYFLKIPCVLDLEPAKRARS